MIALEKYKERSCTRSDSDYKLINFFQTIFQIALDLDTDCDYFFKWWTYDPKYLATRVSWRNPEWIPDDIIQLEYAQTEPLWTWFSLVMILMILTCLYGCCDGEKNKSRDVV